jgi:ribonuclease VapC
VIVVDTSALFAIATEEDERDAFIDILDDVDVAVCSAVTYVETVMVLTGRSRRTARERVKGLFETFRIDIAPVDDAMVEAAVTAFDIYGKGRHRARLNLADCFTYALASTLNVPLLFKGDDFAQTNIIPAWRP